MYINEAWLAGFVEGDGCFSKQKSGNKYYPKIEIHQKNEEPLKAIVDNFGWKFYRGPKISRVYIGYSKAVESFKHLGPYLSSKRINQASKIGLWLNESSLEHNLDWFAGYYEAEGCLFSKNNGQVKKDGTKTVFAGLTVSQYYSRETSDFCLEAVGYGRVAGPYMARGKRRAFSYNLGGKEGIDLIESISHMLSNEKLEQLRRVKDRIG